MPLPHHPSSETLASWPTFTAEAPLRVLVSGCIGGLPCGVDGTSYGHYPLANHILALPNVRAFPFCPEERAYGTPRETPNCHGGNGHDVLDGKATVRMDTDEMPDVTIGLVREGLQMAAFAKENRVHVALMMDVSGACGSTCVYDGRRKNQVYLKGPGVAGAAVMRTGIPVVSQRDERTWRAVLEKLGGLEGAPFTDGLDHHERAWFKTYFAER